MKYTYAFRTGITMGVIGILTLVYNIYKMYGLASQCTQDVTLHPCSAYNTWQIINLVGLGLLIIGIIVTVASIILRKLNAK